MPPDYQNNINLFTKIKDFFLDLKDNLSLSKALKILGIVILLIGLPAGLYLVQQTQIFKPKAFEQKPQKTALEKPSYNGYIIQLKTDPLVKRISPSTQKGIQASSLGSMTSSIQQEHDQVKKEITAKLNKKVLSQPEVDQKDAVVIGLEYGTTINGLAISGISDEEAESLKSLPSVKSVYKNYVYAENLAESVPLIGVDKVWNTNDFKGSAINGQGVKVAVIDTGIEYMHPDFGSCTKAQYESGNCSKVLVGFNFISRNTNAFDDAGHGTHVASIIAADGILKGVAPKAKIVPFKVLDQDGYGFLSDILGALDRVAKTKLDEDISNDIQVVNLSLGLDCLKFFGGYYFDCGPDDLLSLSLDIISDMGIVPVVAAGNSGELGEGSIGSPGTSRKAITVGAIDKAKKIAGFSSIGSVYWGDEEINKPDVVAPGVSICAAKAQARSSTALCVDNFHFAANGTSMASPHIAGVVALYKQAYPDMSPEIVKSVLKYFANNLEININKQGWGMVDALSMFTPPNQSIQIGYGNNLIGLMIDKGRSYTAQKLLADLNEHTPDKSRITKVYRFNSQTNQNEIYELGKGGVDFPVKLGEGYYAVSDKWQGTIPFQGSRSADYLITIPQGTSLISLPKLTSKITNAENLLQEMKRQGINVTQISKFQFGSYQFHPINTKFNNFDLKAGEGYEVKNSGETKVFNFLNFTMPVQEIPKTPPPPIDISDAPVVELWNNSQRPLSFTVEWFTTEPTTGWLRVRKKGSLSWYTVYDKRGQVTSRIHHVNVDYYTAGSSVMFSDTEYEYLLVINGKEYTNKGKYYSARTASANLPPGAPAPFLTRAVSSDNTNLVELITNVELIDSDGKLTPGVSAPYGLIVNTQKEGGQYVGFVSSIIANFTTLDLQKMFNVFREKDKYKIKAYSASGYYGAAEFFIPSSSEYPLLTLSPYNSSSSATETISTTPVVTPSPIPTPAPPSIKVSFKDANGNPISQIACAACWNGSGGYTKPEQCQTGTEVVITKPVLCNTYNPVLGVHLAGANRTEVTNVSATPTSNFKTYMNQYFGWSDIKTWTEGERTLTLTVKPASAPVPVTSKRIFTTSTTYNGNLGGLAGADNKCQERANVANLGGIWKAWLSDNKTSAASRLTHSDGPYKLVNGTIIAKTWADLTDGTLASKIILSETKSFVGNAVWTGTNEKGEIYNPGAPKCKDWTALTNFSPPLGSTGHNFESNYKWTRSSTQNCANKYPLYCIEQ